MILWSFGDTQMWVSHVVDLVPPCRFWNRNFRRAGQLTERTVIGQIRRQLKVPSWYFPEFLEDQLASRRCGEDRSPCQQRGASRRHSKHSLCPGRVCPRGGKSMWIQTWNRKWQVSDLETTVESRMLLLCYIKDLFGASSTESLHIEEVFGGPLGALSLFIIKGLGKWSHML